MFGPCLSVVITPAGGTFLSWIVGSLGFVRCRCISRRTARIPRRRTFVTPLILPFLTMESVPLRSSGCIVVCFAGSVATSTAKVALSIRCGVITGSLPRVAGVWRRVRS